jgi:hypothetical protein
MPWQSSSAGSPMMADAQADPPSLIVGVKDDEHLIVAREASASTQVLLINNKDATLSQVDVLPHSSGEIDGLRGSLRIPLSLIMSVT